MKNIFIHIPETRINAFKDLIYFLKEEYHIILFIEKKIESKLLNDLKSSGNITIYFPNNIPFFMRLNKLISYFSKKPHRSINQIILKNLYQMVFYAEFTFSKKIFNEIDILAFLTVKDRGNISSVGSRYAAKIFKIPIILPYVYLSSPGVAQIYHNPKYYLHDNNCLYQKYIFKKFSSNKYGKQLFKDHFYYIAPILHAQYSFKRSLSKNPWYIGGGISDIIVTHNEASKNNLSNTDFIKHKNIVALGDISHDNLFNSYQNRIKIKREISLNYNLDINQKVIIYSIPPLKEHGFEKDYNSARKTIISVVEYLKKIPNHHLLISCHPRMDINEYLFLEDSYNCTIIKEPLSEYLCISDILVGGFSSTLAWASLCKIKSIVIKLYDEKYTFYDDYETIKIVDNIKDISPEIINFIKDDNISFQKDWTKLSRNEFFDGNVKARYLNLLKSLE